MLQTKSFLISDSEGINSLLKEYRLAAGASILVSDGKVCIPYEDGESMTKSQEIAFLRERINEYSDKKKDILHSNRVVEVLLDDANAKVADAAQKISAHEGKGGKAKLESAHENALSIRNQLENQILMNNHEIFRIDVNIKCFQDAIDALG